MFAGPGFVSTPKVHAFNECSTQLRNKTAFAYKKKKTSTVTLRLCPPPPHPLRHVTLLQSTPSVTLWACPPPIPVVIVPVSAGGGESAPESLFCVVPEVVTFVRFVATVRVGISKPPRFNVCFRSMNIAVHHLIGKSFGTCTGMILLCPAGPSGEKFFFTFCKRIKLCATLASVSFFCLANCLPSRFSVGGLRSLGSFPKIDFKS